MHYTIISHHEEDGSVLTEVVKASDAYAAMGIYARAQMAQGNEAVCVIGVLEGRYTLITPGCDNNASAFVGDVAEFEDGEPFTCAGCGREESACSAEPCPDVIADREETGCTECGAVNDDGEGWNGLCGNCADKAEPAEMLDIVSDSFRVLVGTGPGVGTFIIERISDGATSLRYTGSEATEEYAKLNNAADSITFDAMCAAGEFSHD